MAVSGKKFTIPPLVAVPSTKKPQTVSVGGSDQAPVIYLDGITCFGQLNGIIQVEVGMNHLIPIEAGSVPKTRIIVTGHIRGSVSAMKELRESIDKAIAMAQPEKSQAH